MILLILKLLGTLLLLLLGLCLLLLLCVLFVPFRYRLSGSFQDAKPDGSAEVSWLFRALTLRITCAGGAAVNGSLRLFGIPIYRISGEKEA